MACIRRVKVVETLLFHPDFEYNLTELAESAEVSKATIFSRLRQNEKNITP